MDDETPKKHRLTPELEANIWKKGQSGNPKGRPEGSGISITTEIKRELAKVVPGQKATYLELLIKRIMKQAVQDGDTQMITKIWNYIDGLPVARIGDPDGNKLEMPQIFIPKEED
jgi:hypothetical protein